MLRVKDTEAWKNIEITLCQIEKNSRASRKHAHKVEINAIYISYNRLVTSPPQTILSKEKSKARPDIVQYTNLDATPENTSEAEADKGEEEDNNNSNNLDLLLIYGQASIIAR
jgi:hypothetical protein